MRGLKKFRWVALILVFVGIFLVGDGVFAEDIEIITGDGSSGGNGSGCDSYSYNNSSDTHNCCLKGSRCPHYMGGTGTEFEAAVARASANDASVIWNDSENQKAYERCVGSKYVVWAGIDYDGVKHFSNWHRGAPNYFDPKADSTGWLDGHGNEVDWDRTIEFRGEQVTVRDVRNLLSISGQFAFANRPEYNLAFFCEEMFKSGDETNFVSRSSVKVSLKLPDITNLDISDSDKKTYEQLISANGGNRVFTGNTENSEWERKAKITYNANSALLNGKPLPVATSGSSDAYITVKFRHSIKVKDGATPTSDTPQQVKYSVAVSEKENVKNSWITKRTGEAKSGTLIFTDASAKTPATLETVLHISASDLKPNKRYKICEKITYSVQSTNENGKISYKKEDGVRVDSYSYACAIIDTGEIAAEDEDEPEIKESTCQNLATSAKWSNNLGVTDARSWVRKSTTDYQEVVYARPDEQVKFLHCYYPYAHSAKASLSAPGAAQTAADHGAHYDTYACQPCDVYGNCATCRTRTNNSPYNRISDANIHDYCELKAGVELNNGGDYLFARGNETVDNDLCSGDTGRIHDESYYTNVVDYDNLKGLAWLYNYLVTRTLNVKPTQFYSPYLNSVDYACNDLTEGYYQIVGVDPRAKCGSNSSYKQIKTDKADVGYTFFQYIHYGGTLEASSWVEGQPYPPYHYSDFWGSNGATVGERDGQKARVVVPYNFNTTATVSKTSYASVVYAGESVNFNTNVQILPRINPDVSGKKYATVTPRSSQVQAIQFMVGPEVSQPSDLSGGITSGGDASSVQAFLLGKFGVGSFYNNGYIADTVAGPFNSLSDENGGTPIEGVYNYTVPDVEPGVKYCVAVAVYPADSHGAGYEDYIGGNLPSGANTGDAGQEAGAWRWRWRVSDIKCSTVAKKPNFQVWGAGVFSNGGIVSSSSPKCLNWIISTNNSCSDKRTFGSWAENEVIANGIITRFGSSDGYGYSNYFMRGDYYNSGRISSGLPGGASGKVSNFRDISAQTITNNEANFGNAQISISSDIVERVLARYSASAPAGYQGGYYDGDKATEMAAPIYLQAGDGTVVIYSENNFTINQNIVVADGVYNDIADIPQVVVIAPNITISGNVTRVDAWLVAPSGVVNTCGEFKDGQTSANECNQMLTVNGPVVANRVVLGRTAGAGVGEESINPAERFNLSAANYFWAYSQAENNRQAFTVYQRELAPRY